MHCFLSFLHSFSCCTLFRLWADTQPSTPFLSGFYFNPVQSPNVVHVIFDHRKNIFFVHVLILPDSGCSIFFLLGRRSLNTLDFTCFFYSFQHVKNDLAQPVAAAATSQVKLCPYDEEEPHIWFRLIEEQFAMAGIRSQKLKYANALASLPKQVFWDILDTVDSAMIQISLLIN